MTKREAIQAELDSLSEEELAKVLTVVKDIARAKDRATGTKPGLLSKLKRVKIDAPEDFSANLDLYMSGEKRLGGDEDLH